MVRKARALEIQIVVWLLLLNKENASYQQGLGISYSLFSYIQLPPMLKSSKDSGVRKFATLMLLYFDGSPRLSVEEVKKGGFTTLITPSRN